MKRDDAIVSDLSCWVMAGLFFFGLVTLAVRLREVQVVDAADYTYANDRQSIRRVQTDGRRGRIVDCKGVALAENRHSVSIVCDIGVYQKRSLAKTLSGVREAIDRVGKVVGVPSLVSEATIQRHLRQSLAMPLVAWRDVDFTILSKFAEHEKEFPGFYVRETDERNYPKGRLAAHVLGYVGRERAEGEAGDEKFNFYYPEMRGRSGLEVYYDSYLRGVPGERNLLVDARGFAIREWTVVAPRAGLDLRLTIDCELQGVVENELKDRCGACVVMNPQDGSILAAASMPAFNPNAFVPSLPKALYLKYSTDPTKPLLNRAFGGAYAPGSTFKPVTALAAMSSGFGSQRVCECSGVFLYGTMHLHCAKRWGHGEIDMRHALRESCNVYFCEAGIGAGTNSLVRTARTMGLGSRTGIDFGIDVPGVVPDAEWKRKVYNEPWYPGDLPQMSIGQGMLLVNPLQMARVAGAVGTGFLVVPHLKADLVTAKKPLPFSKGQLQVVRDGMRMVVDGGTGRRGGADIAVHVSGKTGTAEIGVGEHRRKNTWFIAYAPSENPTVAVAMVIENGDSGGGTTAPKVRNILAHIFGVAQPNDAEVKRL